MTRRILISIWLALAAWCGACRPETPPPLPVVPAPSAQVPAPPPYLLHLPGMGGESRIDHSLVGGLSEANGAVRAEIYNWTGPETGFVALRAMERNRAEAKAIAERLTAMYRADPRRRIFLSCHSAGAGLVAWALEGLPSDVHVEAILFLAPALSHDYDLSGALRHVDGHAYVFYSKYDQIVLSIGTKLMGTVDGVKTDAAGFSGFAKPPGADEAQYAKLVQFPYDAAWMKYGNLGDHIGATARPFVLHVIAPLLFGGLPATPAREGPGVRGEDAASKLAG